MFFNGKFQQFIHNTLNLTIFRQGPISLVALKKSRDRNGGPNGLGKCWCLQLLLLLFEQDSEAHYE